MTSDNKQQIGIVTAISFIVANMVGTGVFTSLGFQLSGGVVDIAAIMILWLIGGIIAFCGAQAYGELGSAMPRSGGEYHFLSQIYHPAVGFSAGFFSMFAGFAAPVALAAMALGKYCTVVWPALNPVIPAASVILLVTIIHCLSVKTGGAFQNVFTILKLLLIVAFIVAGFLAPEPQNISVIPTTATWKQITTPGFAVCLIYVFYSFSGWNASAYFVSEMKRPEKNLPLSLLVGTVIVTVLYLLLNFVFLRVSSVDSLSGQLEIGAIAATSIFGPRGGQVMAVVIGLLLISSISSMVFAGPRVIQAIGEDYPALGFMSRRRSNGVPMVAILVQSGISLVLLFTSTFEALISYLGFMMNVYCFLCVLGVFVHRRRFPNAERKFKVWGYPVTPILFLLFFMWNFFYMFTEKTQETLIGLATLLLAGLVYALVRKKRK